MTHGGYRGDRDEWPPQRPRQTSPDDRNDTDPGRGGWPPPPDVAHDDAVEPRTAVPYAGGTPWYGHEPAAPPYGRPEPTYERYPDAYVVEPGGVVPGRRDPANPYGAGGANRPGAGPAPRTDDDLSPMAVPPRPDPRPEMPRGRLADQRPFTPDGRLRRFGPESSPGGGPTGAGVGPDVRSTGQLPIFGPDTPSNGGRRRPDAAPHPAAPHPRSFGPGPQPAGPPPPRLGPLSRDAGGRTAPFAPDPRTTGQHPRAFAPGPQAAPGPQTMDPRTVDPRTTGTQQRYYDADPRALDPRTTGTQQRYYDPDPRAADPRTTGGQPRYYDPDAQAVDPRTTGGQPRIAMDEPSRRRGRVAVAVLAAIVVLVALGFGGVKLLRHDGSTPSNASGATPGPSINTAPISDRTVDPALLTTAEVFGAATIASAAGGTYQVVRSEADPSCGTAATAAISTLLGSLGCNQAVRATLLSADQAYVITAGVLNLPNTASATKAATSLQSDIAKGTGRLNGLSAGGNTEVINTAQAQVAWDTRGHYLMYSIIALTSGKAIAASDKRVPQIITDVVENYLGEKVLGARADRSAAPTPASS